VRTIPFPTTAGHFVADSSSAAMSERNSLRSGCTISEDVLSRDTHCVSVHGRGLDQQRVVVRRLTALRMPHERIRLRADFEPFVHGRRCLFASLYIMGYIATPSNGVRGRTCCSPRGSKGPGGSE